MIVPSTVVSVKAAATGVVFVVGEGSERLACNSAEQIILVYFADNKKEKVKYAFFTLSSNELFNILCLGDAISRYSSLRRRLIDNENK